MHAYVLRIRGLDSEFAFGLARWELFTCPEVRELVKLDGENRFLVLYEGNQAQPKTWCHVLANAGYPATPVERVDELGPT